MLVSHNKHMLTHDNKKPRHKRNHMARTHNPSTNHVFFTFRNSSRKESTQSLEIPSISLIFRVCASSQKWMFTSAADDIPHRRTFLTDNTTKESLILYKITPLHLPLHAFDCYIPSGRAFCVSVSLSHPQGYR